MFGEDYATVDGTRERDYVHVNDLAAAHVRAIDFMAAEGGFMRSIWDRPALFRAAGHRGGGGPS